MISTVINNITPANEKQKIKYRSFKNLDVIALNEDLSKVNIQVQSNTRFIPHTRRLSLVVGIVSRLAKLNLLSFGLRWLILQPIKLFTLEDMAGEGNILMASCCINSLK
jgi:hypothetical protein